MATGDQLLFLKLADALSQPSKAYRAAKAGLDIPEQAIQGYLGGTEAADKIQSAKFGNQTLEQALGGNVPDSVSGYRNSSVKQFKPIGELLTGVAALDKANKPSTPESLDAILADKVNKGLLTMDAAAKIKRSFSPADGRPDKAPPGYRFTANGDLEAIPGGPAKGSPIEQQQKAQGGVSEKLKTISGLYKDLNDSGGIVNTEDTGLSNVVKRVESSGPGQLAGKAFGTKTQSIRNQINQIRPLLINDIRQASKMGAKGLDSEKELEFYLQAATDPSNDIQANLKALDVLDKAYGLGLGLSDGGDEFGGKSFASEQEAEASGYKGPATIAGKRAVIH